MENIKVYCNICGKDFTKEYKILVNDHITESTFKILHAQSHISDDIINCIKIERIVEV